MIHLGDVNKGATVRLPFNSAGADGASITLAANGTAKAYVDGGTTEITSGVTLTEDHDAITGRHFVSVDTTGSGFTPGSDILVAVDGMTIDGKTVNVWVGSFSINRRRGGVSLVGLAQAGASGTVTFPASAVATDDYYNGQLAKIVYGTGAGQSRWVTDYVGSTEHIVKTIKEAPEGTRWLVGTELNLVDRLAREVLPQNKIVQFTATTICMCSTMQRIDPQHLAWTLENLAEGKVVNQILVPDHEAVLAKLALERMLDIS